MKSPRLLIVASGGYEAINAHIRTCLLIELAYKGSTDNFMPLKNEFLNPPNDIELILILLNGKPSRKIKECLQHASKINILVLVFTETVHPRHRSENELWLNINNIGEAMIKAFQFIQQKMTPVQVRRYSPAVLIANGIFYLENYTEIKNHRNRFQETQWNYITLPLRVL